MLLEFDADQRLWQSTVRDVVSKQCPPSLVRSVAEDGVDPSPLWKSYVDLGWTELNDPDSAVELAIVLEGLGHATDPTPFLATMSQFAPLVADRFDPHESGTAVYNGVSAHRDAEGWVLDGLEGSDCDAELLAAADMFEHQIEDALAGANHRDCHARQRNVMCALPVGVQPVTVGDVNLAEGKVRDMQNRVEYRGASGLHLIGGDDEDAGIGHHGQPVRPIAVQDVARRSGQQPAFGITVG